MTRCLLFPFERRSPAANMAFDEWLAGFAAQQNRPALRFYGWTEPALSLGYFQRMADRGQHSPSAACAVVRRSTGGGAILHDREVTYALALPKSHPLARSRRSIALYELVHNSLIDALATIGIEASLSSGRPATREEPFLCFQRRAAGDVLVGEKKIAGSAQRRTAEALLQHGSLLLVRSAFAPELPGAADVCSRKIEPEALLAQWQVALARRFDWTWETTNLGREQIAILDGLESAKYAQTAWTARR